MKKFSLTKKISFDFDDFMMIYEDTTDRIGGWANFFLGIFLTVNYS